MGLYILTTMSSGIPDFLISNDYRPVPDITTTIHYSRRGGTNGQSGEIPVYEYLRKIEQTCMYEGEGMLNDHFRTALKDRTPDPPTLQSDMTRRDRHSTEFLSLRHNAARTAEEPFHPDLMLGFTDADPRGIAVDPQMKKMAMQSEYRVRRYKDFVNDNTSDMTVTGGNRSDARAISDRVKLYAPFKDRFKNFETGRDGRAIRSNHSIKKWSDASLVSDIDLVAPDLRVNESSQGNRDAVTRISNVLPLGSRSIAAHRFKIADYSQVRTGPDVINNDFRNAMDQAEETQNHVESDEAATRAVAYIMSTDANWQTEITGRQTDSTETMDNRKSKKSANVREGFDLAECSEINPASIILQQYMGRPQKAVRICQDTLSRDTDVDQTAFGRLLKEMARSTGVMTFDVHANRDTEETQDQTEGYKTAIYSNPKIHDTHVSRETEHDYRAGAVHNTQDRQNSHQMATPGSNRHSEDDTRWLDATYKDRHLRGLGVKSRMKYAVTEGFERDDNMGEIIGRSRSRGPSQSTMSTSKMRLTYR